MMLRYCFLCSNTRWIIFNASKLRDEVILGSVDCPQCTCPAISEIINEHFNYQKYSPNINEYTLSKQDSTPRK